MEINLTAVILWIVIGALAGWIASILMRGKGFGITLNVVLGIIGAFIGGFIFDFLGIVAVGFIGNLVLATVGAVVFLFLAGLIPKI